MSVLPRIGVFSDPRWAGENGHCLLRAAPVPSLTGFGRRFPATDFLQDNSSRVSAGCASDSHCPGKFVLVMQRQEHEGI